MLKKFLFGAALACVTFSAAAREVAIGVEGVMAGVAERNAEVRSARSSLSASLQGVAAARAERLPQLNASLDLNYIGDGTILDRNFSHAMRDKLPHFGNTLAVTLYQPVYRGGSITAGIDMARQQSELSGIASEQTLDAVTMEALTNFFNLVKMRNLRAVYVENIDITRRLIDQMTEHYNRGTALRNDVTRYELRLSSLTYDLTSVDNAISVINTNLATLLGYDPGDTFVPETDLATEPPLGNEAEWLTATLASSNELKAIDKTRDITHTGLRLERSAMLPNVGIVIGDNLSGPVTFEIPAINKNYNAWFAGVSLSYNFSSLWTANKRMKQKRLELAHISDSRMAMEQALRRKVHEAYVAALQAREMLATEMVNVRLANENYEVVETRFHNDMALLTDMLDASTAKLDAETRLVNARAGLLLSYYQLKYISGTLTSSL